MFSKCRNFIADQELQMDIQDHIASVDYINRTGAELHKKAPEEKAEKLKEDMESMNSRWTKVSNEIDQRVEKLEAAKEQLKQYQVVVFYFSPKLDLPLGLLFEERVERNLTVHFRIRLEVCGDGWKRWRSFYKLISRDLET